jgi:hypothetical protein
MVSKYNKKFIYVVGIVMTLFFVFAKCNHKTHPSINAFIEESTDDWEKIKAEKIDTSNTVRLQLQFLNNPYKFDSRNNMAIYIDNILLFKGSFENLLYISMPKKMFGDRLLPGLVIYDGKKAYHFIHKKSMFLNNEDKYLYITFFPENELVESCYMFAQKEPIL